VLLLCDIGSNIKDQKWQEHVPLYSSQSEMVKRTRDKGRERERERERK
jgi:hypothetical protein